MWSAIGCPKKHRPSVKKNLRGFWPDLLVQRVRLIFRQLILKENWNKKWHVTFWTSHLHSRTNVATKMWGKTQPIQVFHDKILRQSLSQTSSLSPKYAFPNKFTAAHHFATKILSRIFSALRSTLYFLMRKKIARSHFVREKSCSKLCIKFAG